MNRTEEHQHKIERVRWYMDRHSLGAVAVSGIGAFAWLTCGGDNHVGIAGDTGPSAIVVTRGRVCVVCNNIEAPRIRAEEVAGLGIEVCEFPWHQAGQRTGILHDLAGGGTIASDDASHGTQPLEADFAELAYSLLEPEIDRYRWLGRNCSSVVERVARLAEPGQTVAEVAGTLAAECFKAEITPVTLLIAADERINRFRHPIPTDRRINHAVMLVLGGRRWGLVVSLTRIVHFGSVTPELRKRHEAVCTVDAALIGGTVPGRATGDIFRDAVQAYAGGGYPDEWRLHHQGGPTGYAPRSYKPNADDTRTVQPCQAFAWNPSITGTKSEDTILATADGPELLSPTHEWPTLSIEHDGRGFTRPDLLVK